MPFQKIKFSLLWIFFFFSPVIAFSETASNPSVQEGAIVPGAGYSEDAQQVANQICYNAEVTGITDRESIIKLDSALSFSDLQNELHINVKTKGNIGMFSANAEANYLRSVEDKDYTLSLNYYQYISDVVHVQLKGTGIAGALNLSGRNIYITDKNFFGLLCGDEYISSYQQGAVLVMGLNLSFASHMEKSNFEAKVGASFGNIFSAATQVQNAARQYNINGKISIQAYQKGGDPSQLSQILSKDSGGIYYILTCDLKNMDNCVKAASGLLDYAKTRFPTQISFQPDKGLFPLGSGFITHSPVTEYGLTPPPSLVTADVIKNRNYLADSLLENRYYQQKLYELLYGYPVPLDKGSQLFATISTLYQQASNNINTITNPTSPEDGALKCYSHPEYCQKTTDNIQSNLKPITASSLTFLEKIKNVISMNVGGTGQWYPDSDSENPTHFSDYAAQYNTYYDGVMTVTPTLLKDITLHMIAGPANPDWIYLQGSLTGANYSYTGTLCLWDKGKQYCYQYNAHVVPNPFYFTPYATKKA